jgi:hypothetical protein
MKTKIESAKLCHYTKILFPVIHRAAYLSQYYLKNSNQPRRFARHMMTEIRDQHKTASVTKDDPERLLVDHNIWVQIVPEETDLEIARQQLRENLTSQGAIMVGYVLRIGSRLDWKRVQISERLLQKTNS